MGESVLDMWTQVGWRLQGRLTALRILETSLPRGQAEKGTGTPRLKGGPWGGGLYGPWRGPRSRSHCWTPSLACVAATAVPPGGARPWPQRPPGLALLRGPAL